MTESTPGEIIAEANAETAVACHHCSAPLTIAANYCRSCGHAVPNHSKLALENNSILGVVLFYGLLVAMNCVFLVNDFDLETWQNVIAQDAIFITLTIGFALSNSGILKGLYTTSALNPLRIGQAVLVALMFAPAVYFLADSLISGLGIPEINYWPLFENSPAPTLLPILTICIVPGIFEELAFRGYIQGTLNHVMSPAGAMVATTFMFAMIHFSMVSFLWLFPLGLFLGYLRWKFNTLWYGMLTHAFYNGMILYLERIG